MDTWHLMCNNVKSTRNVHSCAQCVTKYNRRVEPWLRGSPQSTKGRFAEQSREKCGLNGWRFSKYKLGNWKCWTQKFKIQSRAHITDTKERERYVVLIASGLFLCKILDTDTGTGVIHSRECLHFAIIGNQNFPSLFLFLAFVPHWLFDYLILMTPP